MHLYIHIPFCDSKCGYCAFYSKVNEESLVQPYLHALMQDLDYQMKHFNVTKVSSVFIGGGTPNFLSASHYDSLFSYLQSFLTQECEITMESNPNLLTEQWLIHVKRLGVNRLSLGVQSFYEDKLALLERKHNQDDILHAFEIAKKHMGNINLDLIYDCKLDTKERMEVELMSAINLQISHLSAYSLSIDSSSSFGKNERYDLQAGESLGEFVRDFLKDKGFKQYEVSNYFHTKKCEHNLSYWSSEEYLGIGVSAVSRLANVRYYTPLNLQTYIANPIHRKLEYLSEENLRFEKIFLGLRSEVGVQKNLLNQQKLHIALSEGMCFEVDGRVYAKDFFLADSLALYLS